MQANTIMSGKPISGQTHSVDSSGLPKEAAKPVTLYLTVDNTRWEVIRRHEMTQLMMRNAQRDRFLYLFFYGPNGEIRRGEIAEDFPANPGPELLEAVWRHAEVLSQPASGEMHSQTAMAVPSFFRAVLYLIRSATLRCPNCGKFGVQKTWFKLKHHCDRCYLRFERGESRDYYLGGILFNLIVAELLFAIAFATTLIIMWPNVPWEKLEYILAGAALAAPIILYPVSKLLWLSFDLLFRPVTAAELEWHRQHVNEEVTPRN